MNRIAYIELDTHAEISANFMDLMQDSKEFLVDYYFSAKISKVVDGEQHTIFLAESSTLLNQLAGKNYDLVIIGTVHRHFNLFLKVSERFNTGVIVHNVNFSKISKSQLLKNIFKKDLRYRLKLLLKEGLLSAPTVFKKATNLLILDESLLSVNPDLKLKFLPVFYFNEFNRDENSTTTIVIPGAVSQRRRDYIHILSSIKNFKTNKNFQFVFLGKAAGRELLWLENFESKKPRNISLTWFTEKVPQPIFDEWMRKADLLWCPLQSETEFFSHKERYGKTKMSGNIGDAIKFGKSAIFPQNYRTTPPFIIYEKTGIEQQILALQNAAEYDFKKMYGKQTVLKSLEKTLTELIKI